MVDKITSDEREMIDRHVAAGEVKVVPPVRRNINTDIIWDTDKKRLKYADENAAKAAMSTSPMFNQKRGKKPDQNVTKRRLKHLEMSKTMTVTQICKETGYPYGTVRQDIKQAGGQILKVRSKDTIKERKQVSAKKKAKVVKDRRRHQINPVATGNAGPGIDPSATGTVFPNRIVDPHSVDRALKDGANNSKIGGDVLVGWLKGAKIFTLTLEERATCPKTCSHWSTCYGNKMQYSDRLIHGPELVNILEKEIKSHCAEFDKVLIRLHVLGDFYSTEYLQFWADQLDLHDNLFVFGFTACPDSTQIGRGITWLREAAPDRFMVRTSNTLGSWGSATINFPTDRKKIGDGIVCPEQLDAAVESVGKVHCGSCAVCWSCDKTIFFFEHGGK